MLARQEPEVNQEDSVEHAREMAAKMTAQLQAGVEQAEQLKIQRDRELEMAKRGQANGLSRLMENFSSFIRPHS